MFEIKVTFWKDIATLYSDNYMEEQNLTIIQFIDNNYLTFIQS